MKKSMIKSQTNQLSFVMIAAALAKYFGLPIPEEAFYSLAGIIIIFLRRGVEQNKSPTSGRIL